MGSKRQSVSTALNALMLIGMCALVACTHPARYLVFQPHRISAVPPFPDHVAGLERIWLETEQGRIEAWLLPGDGVDAGRPGPAVMLAHGNRELIDDYLFRADRYRRMGFSVLLGEYRGYGRSAGSPERDRIASDFIRFFDDLAARPTVDAGRIVFHGRSLGGSVLSELSRQRPPAAIIVESTFTSIKAMARGAPGVLLSDRYDTVSALKAYRGPILILHGTQDDVVPLRHALELKQAIPRAELILYDAGHSDLPTNGDAYWDGVTEFLFRSGVLDSLD